MTPPLASRPWACWATSQFAHADALAAPVQAGAGPPGHLRQRCAGQGHSPRGLVQGGAQGFYEGALAAGADAYLTGEISEPQAHLARETGTTFIAAGHHATERYGAPAVAAHVAPHWG